MKISAVFEFTSPPNANRFLNDVNSNLELAHANAAWFDTQTIKVTYELEAQAYDSTLSTLDDLSSHYGGKALS